MSYFSRPRSGHTLLHSRVSLNYLLMIRLSVYFLPHTPVVCDTNHILFDCSLLSTYRFHVFSLLQSLNITTDTRQILSSQSVTTIIATLSFFF